MSANATATWRPMLAADMSEVIAIAEIVHPDYPEDDAVLAERLMLYAPGCFVLSQGGQIAGYLLSHPWIYGNLPKLNTLLQALPQDADTYYLHDIALLPDAQGQGAASAITTRLAIHAGAAGFAHISLCAVNGSARFWQAQGFARAEVPGVDTHLASYGADAVFMARAL